MLGLVLHTGGTIMVDRTDVVPASWSCGEE